jgi:hypothetical protein
MEEQRKSKAFPGSNRVCLNVNGMSFFPKKSLLMKDPESLLCAIVRDDTLDWPKDENGAYVFKCQPAIFTLIMQYLEIGNVEMDDQLPEVSLLKEAEYFNVQGLIDMMQEKIQGFQTKHFVRRIINCNEEELQGILQTMADGWKIEQVITCPNKDQKTQYIISVTAKFYGPEENVNTAANQKALKKLGYFL